MSKVKPKRPVLVTDTHRGIYFGYLVKHDIPNRTVKLEGMRHCFYYTLTDANEGTYGLATSGPAKGSKIGPCVNATIHDVSKVVDCSVSAVDRWESATWGG